MKLALVAASGLIHRAILLMNLAVKSRMETEGAKDFSAD